MVLKFKKPETILKENKLFRAKFMLSGDYGLGKTTFALNFPKPFFIDCELRGERKEYMEKLQKMNGVYFGKEEGARSFKTVIDTVKELVTTKHDYKTIIIDSYSMLYTLEAAIAEEKGGSEFGRDKKEANKPSRQLLRWLTEADMNVVIICHVKDKWKKLGHEFILESTTFDGYDKLEAIIDLWLEIYMKGKERFFKVKKSNIANFILDESYHLSFIKFEEIYGSEIINKVVEPIKLSTEEDILKLNGLFDLLKITEEEKHRWLEKTDVSSFAEMKQSDINKCILFLENKIKNITGGK